MNTEAYISICNQATTPFEAESASRKIFSCDSSTSGSAYQSAIPVTWDVFYALYDMEKRTGIDHGASSYAAVILSKPKLAANWKKKENIRKYTSLEDYLQDVYLHINGTVMKNWDPEKNDNFWAYLNGELLTVVAKTAKPEISDYYQKKDCVNMVSYEQMLEAPGNDFDLVDRRTNVEDSVMRSIEFEEKAVFHRIVVDNKDELYSKANIRNGLIASQLFGGLDNASNAFASKIAERMEAKKTEKELS